MIRKFLFTLLQKKFSQRMDNWERTGNFSGEDSSSEEETMVGNGEAAFGKIDEVAFWKTKAEEYRKKASEAKEELEEFQNESRF